MLVLLIKNRPVDTMSLHLSLTVIVIVTFLLSNALCSTWYSSEQFLSAIEL